MKKIPLLLFAVLLCTVRVEAYFEAGEGGERDRDHSERGENRDTTARNSDQARVDAARRQASSDGASMTVRDDEFSPSAPPIEEDDLGGSQNKASSASAAGAKDTAIEDIFDDAVRARIKREADQAFSRIKLEQGDVLIISSGESPSSLTSDWLFSRAEALHRSHETWARRSDSYSDMLMSAFATRDVTDVEGQSVGALITACHEVSRISEEYATQLETILLESTRPDAGRGASGATKRLSGSSSEGGKTSPGGSSGDRSIRRYSSGSDSSHSGSSAIKGSPESLANSGRLLDFDLSQLPDVLSLSTAEKADSHGRNQASYHSLGVPTTQAKEGAVMRVAGPAPFPTDEDFFSPREAFSFSSSSLKERQDYMNGFDPVDLRTSHRKSSSLPPGAIVRGPADLPASDSGDRTDSEDAHHVAGNVPLDIGAMRRALDKVPMVTETRVRKSGNKARTIAKWENLQLSDMSDREQLRLEADKIRTKLNAAKERLARSKEAYKKLKQDEQKLSEEIRKEIKKIPWYDWNRSEKKENAYKKLRPIWDSQRDLGYELALEEYEHLEEEYFKQGNERDLLDDENEALKRFSRIRDEILSEFGDEWTDANMEDDPRTVPSFGGAPSRAKLLKAKMASALKASPEYSEAKKEYDRIRDNNTSRFRSTPTSRSEQEIASSGSSRGGEQRYYYGGRYYSSQYLADEARRQQDRLRERAAQAIYTNRMLQQQANQQFQFYNQMNRGF